MATQNMNHSYNIFSSEYFTHINKLFEMFTYKKYIVHKLTMLLLSLVKNSHECGVSCGISPRFWKNKSKNFVKIIFFSEENKALLNFSDRTRSLKQFHVLCIISINNSTYNIKTCRNYLKFLQILSGVFMEYWN